MKRRLAFSILVLGAAGTALAQTKVDQHKPAPGDGIVEIENPAGKTRVIGWNKEEVQVTGTLGRRADGLDFSTRDHRTRISVDVTGEPNDVVSDLEIHVPLGSRIQIESRSASIDVSEIKGRVKAESVSGAISIAGGMSEVEAESVSGAITITGPATRVRAETVSAPLVIKGASGVVEAHAVNARLDVSGGSFQQARLETVNGPVSFDGDVSKGGTLAVETVNGPIELRLPAGLAADFSISLFNGEVDSDFEVRLGPTSGDPSKARQRHEHKEREMHFSTGGGGADVSVTTLNGRVTLRKK